MKSLRVSIYFISIVVLASAFNGCISFRSELEGAFNGTSQTITQAEPAAICFYFSHLEREKGLDVVPKIIQPRRGFRDILGEAMKEISNIKSYATFTDNENDVDDVKRRTLRDSLKEANDFTIHITFNRENSFAKHFFSNLFFYGTATLLPVGFSWDYLITADVSNASGKLLKSYSRNVSLSTWNNFLFLFVYPFYPSEVKIEEIYLESLKNIFKQIEADGVLKK